MTGLEIKKMWSIFAVGESSVLELRALWPKGVGATQPPVNKHFCAKSYATRDDVRAAFEREALRLNVEGYNIYIVMNPIKPEFSGSAATDADVDFRDLLLIDIDRSGDTTVPATEAELDAAKQVADAIEAFMDTRGYADPIRVMSGNGHHLYYVLKDVPNTPEMKKEVQKLLKNLAGKFDTNMVKIDTGVFNASRITKVPGTIARKGMESVGRPYRMAVVL